MSARCEKTDLPEDMCAHCLGHRGPEEEDRRELAALLREPGWVAAQYRGICGRCAEPYGAGMPIHIDREERAWVCGRCAAEAGR